MRGIARSFVALVVLASPAAGAAPATPTLSSLTDEGGTRTFASHALAVPRSSGADALEHAWRAAGLTPASIAVPRSADDPLEILSAAVSRAERLRAAALARLSAADRDAVLSPWAAPESSRSSDVTGAIARAHAGGLRPAARAALEKVDADALATAALLVARAAEDVLPMLGPPKGSPRAASTCGAGGDVVFETSDCSIVVGNTGPNSYPDAVDSEILIDLGGNDTYGGATAYGSQDVRVVIDVSGDDTYERTDTLAVPGDPFDVVAQGVGTLGVGVLLDAGGDDIYRVEAVTTAPQPGPIAALSRAVGQGTGFAGAGALIDLGGSDSYAASASSSGWQALVHAQGSSVAGAGALIDMSNADDHDTYTAAATSTLHHTTSSDTLDEFDIGSSGVVAQAGGELGIGVLVDAAGDDDYLAHAAGGTTAVVAQGAGVGGAGLLIDAAGDDRMEAIADGEVVVELSPSAGCWAPLHVSTLGTGDSTTIAQGAGLLGAGGLIDGGGSDDRSAAASAIARAIAEVSGSACSINDVKADAEVGSGLTRAQGSAEIGVGILVDVSGADRNDLVGTSEAEARAIIHPPGGGTETVNTEAGEGTTKGQGHQELGLGLSLDLDGADGYHSSAWTVTTEVTSEPGVSVLRLGSELVQGYGMGLGHGWLIDVGGDDDYSTSGGASAAANDACWSNGSPDGRGRDLSVGLPPPGCP